MSDHSESSAVEVMPSLAEWERWSKRRSTVASNTGRMLDPYEVAERVRDKVHQAEAARRADAGLVDLGGQAEGSFTFNETVGAIYCRLTNAPVARQEGPSQATAIIDRAADGSIIGIEVVLGRPS